MKTFLKTLWIKFRDIEINHTTSILIVVSLWLIGCIWYINTYAIPNKDKAEPVITIDNKATPFTYDGILLYPVDTLSYETLEITGLYGQLLRYVETFGEKPIEIQLTKGYYEILIDNKEIYKILL